MVCSACGRPAAEGQRFCTGCGEALETVCRRCGRPCAPGDRFCGSCGTNLSEEAPDRIPKDYTPRHLAERILRQRGAIEGERKEVTVLFADVKGSMDLAASVDPEEWHAILDRFFGVLSEGVHRFEGSINQYTGDGIMALFGAPLALEDHARYACHAALWLRDAVRDLGRELRREKGLDFAARFGLNSGSVVVAAIGDDLRMDYTAQGHVVGLAARMEQLAEAGTVYLAPATARLVEPYFELEDLGRFSIKGATGETRAFELRGGGALTRLDVSRSRGLSRFVGRATELRKLESSVDSDSQPRRISVVARAGQGKSRLCFEFTARRRAAGAFVFHAVGLAHARGVAYLPVLQLFREVLGLADGERGRAARDRVAGRILLLGERFRGHVSLVCELLGLSEGTSGAALDQDVRKKRLLEVLAALVGEVSTRAEVVLWIDDLHWLDEASESFLRELLARHLDGRVLVLGTFRPEYDAAWMLEAGFESVELAPLDASEMIRLIEENLGDSESVGPTAEMIRERSAGNPFFAEEIVRTLAESGELEGEPGNYRAGSSSLTIEIPGTVHGVLAARIDRLAEDSKFVLQACSVIGRDFGRAVLEPVSGLETARLDAALSDLVTRGFLYPTSRYPDEGYAFEHPLTQEVAEGTLLSERRRKLHRAVARAIEAEDSERADERAALIAEHWESGGSIPEAAAWHRRAALWTSLGDLNATVRHWVRIREIVEADTEDLDALAVRLRACREILSLASRVRVQSSDLAAVRREGRAAAQRLSDPSSQAAIESSYALNRGLEGDLQGALESLRAARPLAERGGDVEAVADFALTAGHVYSWGGRCIDQIQVSDLGLRHCEANPGRGDEGIAAWLHAMRGDGLAHSGHLDRGAAELERALTLASTERMTEVRGFTLAHQVRLYTLAGRYDDACRAAEQAFAYGEDSGSAGVWGTAAGYRAATDVARGRWGAAIEQIQEILGYLRQGGIVVFRSFALTQLALAHGGSGDLAAARESSAAALEVSQRCGTAGYEVLARFALAQASILGGEIEAVDQQLDAAGELMEELGLRVYEPDLCLWRSRREALAGNDAAARDWKNRALHSMRQIGATERAEALAAG